MVRSAARTHLWHMVPWQ